MLPDFKKPFFLFAMVLFIALSLSPAWARSPSTLSFWGDSQTDCGNVWTMFLAVAPEAAAAGDPQITNGRLSNGPNWADYVGSAHGLEIEASLLGGVNHAYGGALMGQGETLVPELPFDSQVPNVGKVLDEYSAGGGGFTAEETVFLYAGHNDALKIATTGEMADPLVVAREFRDNLVKLYTGGARRIVAPTLVALDKAPEASKYGVEEAIAAWIAAYRVYAEAVVGVFRSQYPDVQVLVPDITSLIHKIVADPIAHGFTNVTEQGFDHATGQARPDVDGYLWWDVHVTTKGHKLIADEVLKVLGHESHTQ